jgi:hypothetical protein
MTTEQPTIAELFHHSVRTSWALCILIAYFTLPDLLEDEQLAPRALLLNACAREMVFPAEPQPLEAALDSTRYKALELGREALHMGYAGNALRPAGEWIAEARDCIAYSPVLTPEQVEHILASIEAVEG